MLRVRGVRLCWRRPFSSRPSPEESLSTAHQRAQMSRPSHARWRRPPFLKGIFRGKFDTELLSFPEILGPEELAQLEEHVARLAPLVQRHTGEEGFQEELLRPLAEMGLFGRTLPPQYGGLGLTHTASVRLGEALGPHWALGAALAHHEFLAAQVLVQFGSEAQKSLHLPRLARGECVAALCCSELDSGSDFPSVRACAAEAAGSSFVLSGTKAWVSNAGRAGLFLVLARTGEKSGPLSVFLVERGAAGVEVAPQDAPTGLNGLATGIVHFHEVSVPAANLVGSLGSGSQIYLKALESFRIASSSITFGALKSLFGSVVSSVTRRERGGRSLADYDAVRVRLSRVQSRLYGLESAAYFTAALLDSSLDPDLALEAAALKVLSSEATAFCVDGLGEALGPPTPLLGRMERDARALHHADGSVDVCRLFLGLGGCREVGEKSLEAITHARNPLYFPMAATRRALRHWKIRRGMFKFDQDIAGHIHPTLTEWGNALERKVQLLEVATEECLREYGRGVVSVQQDPMRLASVGAELYAWAAVLARASRSYCIGLANAHHEVRLAATYCSEAQARVETTLEQLFRGSILNDDRNHLLLGEQAVDVQGYFPEHPLKHNF